MYFNLPVIKLFIYAVNWNYLIVCVFQFRYPLTVLCCKATQHRIKASGRQRRGCIIPQAVTQSNAPEDGRNHRRKCVELIGIINKPLLLHLVGCLYYLYQ
jgi:hypothetical protein